MKKVFYGWFIVLTGTLLTSVALGLLAVIGIFFPTMAETHGFTQAQMSAIVAFTTFGMLLGSVFLGKLQMKTGGRKLILICGLVEGIGIILLGRVTSLPALYASAIVLGIASIGAAALTLPTILSRWFQEKRGTAIGINSAGIGLSSFVYAPILTKVIVTQGYQNAFLYLGLLLVAYSVLGFIVIRDTPEEMGMKAYGLNPGDIKESKEKTKKADEKISVPSLTLKEAFGSSVFWFYLLFVLTTAMTAVWIFIHIPTYLLDIGFSTTRLAVTLSAFGLFSLLGKLAVGAIYDKFSIKASTLLICALGILAFIALKLLPVMDSFIYVYIVLAGGSLAFGAVANPILTGRLFGVKHYSEIYGIVMLISTFVSIIGSVVSGSVVDTLGFDTLFNVGIGLVAFSGLAIHLTMTASDNRNKYTESVELE